MIGSPLPGTPSILPGFAVPHFSLGNWPSGSRFSTKKCASTLRWPSSIWFFSFNKNYHRDAPSRQALPGGSGCGQVSDSDKLLSLTAHLSRKRPALDPDRGAQASLYPVYVLLFLSFFRQHLARDICNRGICGMNEKQTRGRRGRRKPGISRDGEVCVGRMPMEKLQATAVPCGWDPGGGKTCPLEVWALTPTEYFSIFFQYSGQERTAAK